MTTNPDNLHEFPPILYSVIHDALRYYERKHRGRGKHMLKFNKTGSKKKEDEGVGYIRKADAADAAVIMLKEYRSEYNRLVREERARLTGGAK